MTVEFLSLPDRRLAYQRLRGVENATQIVFLGGYASDMTGTKATFLAERCAAANLNFIRFDYTGNGQSDGAFEGCTLSHWLADAKAIIEHLTSGPLIIAGSSMGGWLGLLLARDMPDRIKALIGIAAAPDFTEDLIWDRLDLAQRKAVRQKGGIRNGEGKAGFVSLRMIEDARSHLVLRQPLKLQCPLRLIQGMQDDQVPWETASRILQQADQPDIRVTYVKDGDHRLNRIADLGLMWRTVEEFLS